MIDNIIRGSSPAGRGKRLENAWGIKALAGSIPAASATFWNVGRYGWLRQFAKLFWVTPM